ncbi:hypothetical protein BH747_09950 [Enterococcus villorum]|uniref:Sensor histidine kinase NatK-like C-terminal domain-containing protein n=1 Tax=Enterococcus villorum TaxID=112904 RepID=A0A1V8YAD0_9ENTE|nr:GHKL domain-containing protein [Enterococcus villorum]OQO69583.1 hypothetical protein BH747_09950 [Enterococcus villorum]OQO72665.1 hypothetical protein BH744_11150 [Enterococcus villorum]
MTVELLFFYWYVPNKNFSLKAKLLNSFVILLLAVLTIFLPDLYVWLISLMYLSGYIYLYYNSRSLIYSVWYTLLAYVIIQVSETSTYHVVDDLIILENMNIIKGWMLFTFVTCIEITIFLLLIYCTKKIKNDIELLGYINSLSKKIKITIIIYCIIFILIAYLQGFQARMSEASYWFDNIILFFLVVIFIGVLYFLTSIESYRNEVKQLNTIFKQEIERTKEIKKFRHDYKNILLSLQIYLAENNIDEAKMLLEEISGYSNSILTDNMFRDLNKIKIIPVKSILFFKIKEAMDKKIKINFHVNEELNKASINTLDFVRVLSNIIDNAIEACVEIKEDPYISILIFRRSEFLVIEIENNYLDKEEGFFNNLTKAGFTTKNNHEGIGLFYLSNLVNTNSNINYSIEKNKHFFKVMILINILPD